MTISATYAPLKDFDDVERLDPEARNTAVGAGKLLGFWDGEKVKLDSGRHFFCDHDRGQGRFLQKSEARGRYGYDQVRYSDNDPGQLYRKIREQL